MSPDPVDIGGGSLNLYTYVDNDPVNRIDPSGKFIQYFINVLRNWGRRTFLIPEQDLKREFGGTYLDTDMMIKTAGKTRHITPDQKTAMEEGAIKTGMSTAESFALMPVTTVEQSIGQVAIENTIDATTELIQNNGSNSTATNVATNGTPVVSEQGTTEIITPGDPNEKVGPEGYGPDRIISADDELYYTVYFENDPEIASAPAQEVFITDNLDENLDWSTFRPTEIVWGDYTISIPPDAASFSTRQTITDYRPEVDKSWWVDVNVEIDGSGTVVWTFRTLDPETGDLPEDVLAGFLPVNDESGRGEGHVAFTITLKPGLQDGTRITNKASIVFDVEDAIETNEVFNTIGTVAETVPGDVDSNETVNAVDVQLVINEALGIDTGYDCDINVDGDINAMDVQLVINAALGLL